MKIAFWNINMGVGSFSDKKAAFSAWCAALQPDLLFLEEASATLTDNDAAVLEQLSSMTVVNYAGTLDKNDGPSTKQLVALCQPAAAGTFQSRPLRLGANGVRMAIKVTRALPAPAIELYGIHSNASDAGGAAGLAAAQVLVGVAGRVVVGGDFNCSSEAASNSVVSHNYKDWPLVITQWSNSGTSMSPADQKTWFGFDTMFVNNTPKPSAKGAIDFLIHSAAVDAKPVPNCTTEKMWRDIVAQFDHAPITYQIA